jgi:threonine/homoserine/homoserine lactone efflux protein
VRRWLWYLLALILVGLLAWGGYAAYASYQGLRAKVAALEARLSAQEEALKGLAERVGKLEEEVFKAPTPPLSLPEVPEAGGAPVWPYAVGVVVAAVLLYLLLRLLRGQEPKAQAPSPASPDLEASRMTDERAPPPPGERG